MVSDDFVESFRHVSVPTLTDVLDFDYALRNSMSSTIISLVPKRRVVGRAITAQWTIGGYPMASLDPLFDAIDSITADQVFVITNGGNQTSACMGDLVAAALHERGAEGAVMDGPIRDIEPIVEMGFAVFSSGVCPVNVGGKATVSAGHPIMCGGVQVRPGDIVVADWDGVVVVPQEIAKEVLSKASAIDSSEAKLREQIRAQIRTRKLADIFAEARVHGVEPESVGDS